MCECVCVCECVCACVHACVVVCVVVVTKDNPQGDVGRRSGRIEQMSWPRRQEEMGKISEGGSALALTQECKQQTTILKSG